MEHKPYAEVERLADVRTVSTKPAMTLNERLERWAEVLEREPTRELKSLEEIEYRSKTERRNLRADNSALTVAFEDPVLRAEGLASDRLGDASDLFGLSVTSAHYTLCSCIHGQTVRAGEAAIRVRHLIAPERAKMKTFVLVGGGIVALLALSGISGIIN